MDFTKLKLVTEMYVDSNSMGQGSMAGAKLTQQANVKASQQAQAPKQTTVTANNLGSQQNQMAQKQGNVKAQTVQKQGGAPSKSATTSGPGTVVSHYDYFQALQARKEYVKQLDEKKSDWKTELKEALGADDEVFHPYVEVMPFKDFKQNEAKKNLAGQAMKQGAAENPAQAKAKKELMSAQNEEYVDERVYMQPQGDERKKREKEDKEKKAKAAQDAVRHMRATKGIVGYDAKGKYHLKNGKKDYENAD